MQTDVIQTPKGQGIVLGLIGPAELNDGLVLLIRDGELFGWVLILIACDFLEFAFLGFTKSSL